MDPAAAFQHAQGTLCTALHQTPQAVGQMPWPDVVDLFDYWGDWPPAHVLLRLQVLGPPEVKGAPKYSSADEIRNFAQMVNGG